MTTAKEFEEGLIRERMRIRTAKAEEVMAEYNRLQKKLDTLQEHAEFLALENFKDNARLEKLNNQLKQTA